ncbi:MAG: efflux RND transporter periplasmic adaptor subunit [Bacteroidota bacterium]
MNKLSTIAPRVLGGICLLLAACGTVEQEASTSTNSTKRVRTAQVESVDYRQQVFATGLVSLSKEVKLSFKTGGIVESVRVEEGTQVKKGQLLATLKLDEVKAQVTSAQLQYDKAQRDLERTQALFADSVATLEQIQNAQTQLEATESQLEAAKFNMKYSRITAPYDGVILQKLVSEDELVGAGSPVFYFGARSEQKILTVSLTAREIGAVTVGNNAQVSFDALEGKTFAGAVTEKSEIADPSTNTFEVEITLADPGAQLYSGFVGSAYIHTAQAQPMVRIPIDALHEARRQQASVYLLDSNQARLQSVTIGAIQGAYVLIREGLQPGQQVITEGVGYLQEGETVQVVNVAQP